MSTRCSWLPFVGECLFPRGCALCGRPLVERDEAWWGLCDDCRGALRAALAGETRERCPRCGRPLISEQGVCLSCRGGYRRSGVDGGDAPGGLALGGPASGGLAPGGPAPGAPPPVDRIVSLFPYAGPYRLLLRAFKFDQSRGAARFLAALVRETTAGLLLPGDDPARAALVPTPPRPGKLRATGWDQIEYLARALERDGVEGLPVCRCLRRLSSQAQKELDQEHRRLNLRGRIVARRRPPAVAVLFDDVITTGSTMEACAEALRTAGTERVYGICLFYD